MIIKSFEINKINLDLNNLFLLYGKNNGFKNEFTKNIIKKSTKININKINKKITNTRAIFFITYFQNFLSQSNF